MKPIPVLPSLQAGRAFAAIAVVSYHASKLIQLPKYGNVHFLDSWFISGGMGVDFFFVLSGFIIAHAHAKDIGKRQALGRYAWNRFSRVYPIYWIYLTAFVIASLLMGKTFAATALFRSFSLFGQTDAPPIISQAWTLFHEVFFYAVFATLILNRRVGVLLFGGWILLCALYPQAQAGVILGRINLEFSFGIFSWNIFCRCNARYCWFPLILGGVAILTIIWLDHIYLQPGPSTRLITGIASSVLILGLAMADKAARFRIPKALMYLGAASYSIYLTHYAVLPVLARAARQLGSLPPAVMVMSLIAGSVGVGCALYALLERPLLKHLRYR